MFEDNYSYNPPYQKMRSFDPVVRAKEDVRSAISEVDTAMDEINKGKQIDPLSEKGKMYLQNLSLSYQHLKKALTYLTNIPPSIY